MQGNHTPSLDIRGPKLRRLTLGLLKAKALEAHAEETGSPWSRRLTAAAMPTLMAKVRSMDSKVVKEVTDVNPVGLDLHTTLDDINDAYQDLKKSTIYF